MQVEEADHLRSPNIYTYQLVGGTRIRRMQQPKIS